MRVEDQKILVALKEAGTIRGAAKELLISQPALSQRLKHIEDHWGQKIFIRSHKRLALTPAGEQIVEFANRVISEERKVRDEVSIHSGGIGGTLSLGVSSVIGQYVLPKMLETYINQHPYVKIDLETGLSEGFRQAPDHFHICIIRGEPIKQEHCQELFSDKLYLVEKKESNKNTRDKPLIEFQADSSYGSTVNEWFLQNSNISYSQKIKVDQIETCKQLMSKGIGMAVLPEIAIQDLNDQEYLIHPLHLKGKAITRKTWICTSDTARQLPQVQAFFQVLKLGI
ncbi:LysR family transcriptional regulator [Pontibacillus sp. HMF3514]|uniref:LysR family transcriptional regulator n=1 Tax=Pontibacillus sp. HMF3514 TaxID=2692425 RepID=UPI00131FC3AC|nr:LysR family transcriptional regulator [Pontibacillus sp. HMF3514]QHE52685.1 LysR family transcriptional regulator [Pontibacillus sp. HMF3514]